MQTSVCLKIVKKRLTKEGERGGGSRGKQKREEDNNVGPEVWYEL